MKSEGDVDMYVFRWHFGFRVANLWLILIGGSLFDQLDTLIDSPSKIVELLGTSVPAKGEVSFCVKACRQKVSRARGLSKQRHKAGGQVATIAKTLERRNRMYRRRPFLASWATDGLRQTLDCGLLRMLI